MIAIDTNLLVYALHPGAPAHARARAAMDKAQSDRRGWGIAVPSALEFWSVATRRREGAAIARPSEAAQFLVALHRAGAQLWQGQPELGPRLLAAARQQEVTGPRIFDLQIALIALDHAATEIWTHDHGFVQVPGLRVVDPLA